jgi:hypothetical protein
VRAGLSGARCHGLGRRQALRSRSRSRVIQEARPPAVEVAVGPAG